jgi:hypothetical protein
MGRMRLPSSVAAVLLHLALRTCWLSGPGSLVAGGQLSLSLAGSAIENAPRTSSDGRTDKVLYILVGTRACKARHGTDAVYI